MTTYYVEENNKIVKCTPSERVAKTWGSYKTTEENIVYGYDGKLYLESECPEEPAPTEEEQRQKREEYRKEHIDSQTAMRSRKIANQTWTADDERAYLDLDAEVTAYIEEHFTYQVGELNV